ncbi:MAG TPA: type II CAAX endopeptidase family protein [Thermoanaerobaculia bacterium]|nr:type II CAAX endopeptidase family protein [Thermoanaerobaculia bacterium]
MKTLLTILLAIGLFVVAAALPHLVDTHAYPWLPQVLTKLIMLVEAFIAMFLARRPLSDFGFRRSDGRSRALIFGAFVLGAAATLLILSLGLKGLSSVMKGHTFVQIVLFVWLWSSIVEEIFVRGWLQSTIARQGLSERATIAISALFFGSLHLSLLRTSVEPASVACIVTFTTILGFICATLRQRTRSLLPSILAHIGFNVGGMFGGIAWMIATKAAR